MAGVCYREIAPSAPLRAFVDKFWTLEHHGTPEPQRVVPDGHSELILNFEAPFEYLDASGWRRQPRIFFAGQIRGPLMLRPHAQARILGVRFTPHGAATVLAPPMHELTARFTALDEISPTLHRDLDRALDAPHPIPTVEAALLRAAAGRRNDPLITAAVEQIARANGAVNLESLAGDLNLSRRQFERRFQDVVGLSPKMFCGLRRFVQVFRVLDEPNPRWVETALACGYYDQAHLIRDVKRFSGETPAMLLGPQADLARHFVSRFGMSHSSNTFPRRAM
jgi:AraC-like DNA-binding protein